MFIKKGLLKGVFLILISTSIFAVNVYDEFENAKRFYVSKDLVKSAYSLEKVLNEVSDYEDALLLYFKVKFEMGEDFDIVLDNRDKTKYVYEKGGTLLVAKLFHKLLNSSDKTKLDLFHYLMLNKRLDLLEYTYDSIKNKLAVRELFLEHLFSMKQYSKIINKYPDIIYIKKIEKAKSAADDAYFKALAALKSNDSGLALELLKQAIDLYPQNGVYYKKIGQLYADNKNYTLAQYNLQTALTLLDDEETKITLFNLYYNQKKFDEMYHVAKSISHIKEVRRKLKSVYYRQEDNRVLIRIISRHGSFITADKRVLLENYGLLAHSGTRNIDYKNSGGLKIGDTFKLSKPVTAIYDNKTGEKLADRSIPVARIRISNMEKKLVTFKIIEEFLFVKEDTEYVIK